MKTAYKTMTYGVTHMIVAFFAAWLVSGSLLVAVGISMVEPAFQISAYFIHEKLWAKFGDQTKTAANVSPTANNAFAKNDNYNYTCMAPCCSSLISVAFGNSQEDKKEAA